MQRKTILITGGTGSLGRALIERLSTTNAVHVVSRDEAKHWTLRNELQPNQNVTFHIGDVRDAARIVDVMVSVDPHIVISAAALKHVDACEAAPCESSATNVVGVQNVVAACKAIVRAAGRLECMLQVSTDKACEPVNVYGMCKALAERFVTSQPSIGHAKFVVVRYGNVLESRGSIVPLFKFQAECKPSFTVTDPDMTRFVMTLNDSVDLIMAAIHEADNGETWVPRIPSMRIGDLAELFSELHGKPISRIAVRPGEKTHEDLIGHAEAVRTRGTSVFWPDPTSWGFSHYIINPSNRPLSWYVQEHKHLLTDGFRSNQSVMSKDALRQHLTKLGILSASLASFKGQHIEEIRTA